MRKTFLEWLEAIAMSGVGAPPTNTDLGDDDEGDNHEWWQPHTEQAVFHWMSSSSPCYKKICNMIVEAILAGHETSWSEERPTSEQGGFGRIFLEWTIEPNKVGLLEQVKQVLLRGCDLWHLLGIPQNQVWEAIQAPQSSDRLIKTIVLSGATGQKMEPNVKFATYETIKKSSYYQDMVFNFVESYNNRFRTTTTADQWRIQPNILVGHYLTQRPEQLTVRGEQSYSFDIKRDRRLMK